MSKKLSARQTVFLSALVLLGRLSVMSESSVGRDTWIVFLSLPLLSLPLIMLYCGVIRKGPDIPAVFTASLGRVPGYAALTVLSFSALVIGASGIDLFNLFISSSPMEYDTTVRGVILMSVTYFVMLSVPSEGFGSAVNILFPTAAFLAVIGVIASFGEMDFGAVLPVLENGAEPVFKGIASSFLLQIAPVFYMICIAETDGKTKRVWIGLVIACFLLLINHLRNVMILGYPAVTEYRFPNYIALSQISLGDIFQGMEIITAQIFVICQPVKSAVCLRFVQEWLSSAIPKTEKIWRIVLPFLCALLSISGFTGTNTESGLFKAVTGVPLIAIPALMFISDGVQKAKNVLFAHRT